MQLLASYPKANDQDKAECQNKLTKAQGILLKSVYWIGIFFPVWVSSQRDNLFFNVHKTGFYILQLQEFGSFQLKLFLEAVSGDSFHDIMDCGWLFFFLLVLVVLRNSVFFFFLNFKVHRWFTFPFWLFKSLSELL